MAKGLLYLLIAVLLLPSLGLFDASQDLDVKSCPGWTAAILPCSGASFALLFFIVSVLILATAVFTQYRTQHRCLYALFLSGLWGKSALLQWLARFQLSPSLA